MTSRLLQAAALLAVWMVVLGSTDPLDAMLGLVVAAAVLALPVPGVSVGGQGLGVMRRAWGLPIFAWGLLREVVRGTWDVALRVAHLRAIEQPGVVEVPVGDRTELGVAVTALATTLSPGTVLIDIDRERAVMIFHVIDATDPDAARAAIDGFYERYQRKAFP